MRPATRSPVIHSSIRAIVIASVIATKRARTCGSTLASIRAMVIARTNASSIQ